MGTRHLAFVAVTPSGVVVAMITAELASDPIEAAIEAGRAIERQAFKDHCAELGVDPETVTLRRPTWQEARDAGAEEDFTPQPQPATT
jgi:hypothetical protein